MATEHPGKRSDPNKLKREQAAINKSLERQYNPNSPIKTLVLGIQQKIAVRRGRRLGYGPAPQHQGATVVGVGRRAAKPPRTEA